MITKIEYLEVLPQTLIDLLKKTERLTIRLSADEPVDVETHLHSSKLGGVAYFPSDMAYPRNDDGQPLVLIAQLNLDDIFADPNIAKACDEDAVLKNYPRTGMLSFFNDATDDLMGLDNFVGQLAGYKVMYFPKIIKDEANNALKEFNELIELLDEDNYEQYGILDLNDSYLITASLKYTVPSLNISPLNDESLMKLHDYTDNQLDERNDDNIITALYDQSTELCQGHAMGGYPILTQADPRDQNDNRTILLLQIDSVGEVMIGDCGSMQFFISEEDLNNRDFSKVLYDWACY